MKFFYVGALCYFLILGCDFSDIVFPEEVVPRPEITDIQFKKKSLFFRWNTKKISEEIMAYKVTYGFEDNDNSAKTLIVGESAQDVGYTIDGLKSGVEYFVTVSAVYVDFESVPSYKKMGITGKPNPPSNFTVTKGSSHWFLDVAWEKNPYNDDFEDLEYELHYWDTARPVATKKIKRRARSTGEVRYGIEDVFAPTKEYEFELVVKSNTLSSNATSAVVAVSIEDTFLNEPSGSFGEGIYSPSKTPSASIVGMAFDFDNALYALYENVELQKITNLQPKRIVFNNSINGNERSTLSGGVENASFFNNSNGIAVDSQGRIYVAVTDDDRIKTIDSSGNVGELHASFPQVSGAGGCSTISRPHNPVVDAQDNLYFFDLCSTSNRIIKMEFKAFSGMTVMAQFPRVGATPTTTDNFLAVDDTGVIYAVGSGFAYARVVQPDGTSDMLKQSDGLPFNFFGNVKGIAVDKKRNLYVLGEFNRDNAIHMNAIHMIDAQKNVHRITSGRGLKNMHLDAHGNLVVSTFTRAKKLTMKLEHVR